MPAPWTDPAAVERTRALMRAVGQAPIARSRSVPRPWSERLARRLEAARRAVLPRERLAARQAWRDRRLMALAAHKAAAERTIEEE